MSQSTGKQLEPPSDLRALLSCPQGESTAKIESFSKERWTWACRLTSSCPHPSVLKQNSATEPSCWPGLLQGGLDGAAWPGKAGWNPPPHTHPAPHGLISQKCPEESGKFSRNRSFLAVPQPCWAAPGPAGSKIGTTEVIPADANQIRFPICQDQTAEE